jgi:putative membrane protein
MRLAVFSAGLGALAFLWLGPLPELATGSFSAHMTLHMGVVAVAAPAIALGTAGRRWDPVRGAPRLFAPLAWSVLELLVVWAWHAPALHHAARSSAGVLWIEQASFLLSGLFLWLSAFGGGERERGARSASGVVALLLTSMHMTLLGALLALPPRALYLHDAATSSLSALDEQHLGGAIMLAVGGVVYLAGGLTLSLELLKGVKLPCAGGGR